MPTSNTTSVRRLLGGVGEDGEGSWGDEGSEGDVAEDVAAAGARSLEAATGVFNARNGWKRIPYHGDGTERRSAHGDILLTRPSPRESDAERLLRDFERPPFINDDQWLLRTETVQFYLGGRSSGAQPHWHGAAWNWLVHGRKRWYLWPPSSATYTQHHVSFSVGPLAAAPGGAAAASDSLGGALNATGRPLLCEQRAGEVLIVPELWGHATVNLAPSVGWASELVFDRSYDDGLGATHGSEWWRTGERRRPKRNRR